jgi:hypothetical protein
LKTADPTTAPIPISSLAINKPIREAANSGAEEPAAIKVDPATDDSIYSNRDQFKSIFD